MSDARDAFINATIDILSAFRVAQNLPGGQTGQLMAPMNLAMLPLYILALLKHVSFEAYSEIPFYNHTFIFQDCFPSWNQYTAG